MNKVFEKEEPIFLGASYCPKCTHITNSEFLWMFGQCGDCEEKENLRSRSSDGRAHG